MRGAQTRSGRVPGWVSLLLSFAALSTWAVFGGDKERLKERLVNWTMGAAAAQFVRSNVCQVDANADGVPDVVALSGVADANGPAVILNGRTGEVMWSGGTYSLGARVLCPNPRTFLVVDIHSFDVILHMAARPNTPLTRTLTDKAETWSFGAECMIVQTADGRRHALDLKTLDPTECPNASSPKYLVQLESDWLERPEVWYSQRGATRYRVWARNPGTPILSASAVGSRSWSAELPYQNERIAPVLTERTLTVLGFPIGAEERVPHLVGLDANDGRLLFDQSLCPTLGAFIRTVAASGGNVLLADYSSGVWMLNGATGEVLWHHGFCASLQRRKAW